ncbi:hypothetical protein LCG94_03540 [Aeromonas salmonicida]|uniref:hypothetical protein n=1 Tax=Aeromonas salmonicida TaxID=645 RepID=UPI003BB57646
MLLHLEHAGPPAEIPCLQLGKGNPTPASDPGQQCPGDRRCVLRRLERQLAIPVCVVMVPAQGERQAPHLGSDRFPDAAMADQALAHTAQGQLSASGFDDGRVEKGTGQLRELGQQVATVWGRNQYRRAVGQGGAKLCQPLPHLQQHHPHLWNKDRMGRHHPSFSTISSLSSSGPRRASN